MTMETSSQLTLWFILWGMAVAILLWRQWRSAGSGILLAYLLHFIALHGMGALLYMLPWYGSYVGFTRIDLVAAGFEQSVHGIWAFVMGSLMMAPLIQRVWPSRRHRGEVIHPYQRLPEIYMIMGGVSYGILSSLLGWIPTLSAIISVSQNLFVAGLCLACWRAWQMRRRGNMIKWFGVALAIPFITILTRGFMGYGAVATLVVGSFIVSFFRPRWKVILASMLLGYGAMSLYVTYMRDRPELREVVWGGAPYTERFERLWTTLQTIEWFDPYDAAHLARIDERLNQNLLVGAAVHRLSESKDFAYGETLVDALLALIPRAVWPDKPVRAGSPGLVSRFTGLQFAEGTSVGIGHVMEFYVNFGTPGVWSGFLVLGILITFIDKLAKRRLEEGHWQAFALWFLVGISFLQVGGSLVELAGSAGASVVAAMLVNRFSARGVRQRVEYLPGGRIEESSW